jgi:hypothetical protein
MAPTSSCWHAAPCPNEGTVAADRICRQRNKQARGKEEAFSLFFIEMNFAQLLLRRPSAHTIEEQCQTE